MRPRFRLWDRKSGERIDAMTPGFGFALAEYLTGSITFNRDEFESLVIVEQSTGLKDKNGRDIYEGDIVKISTVDIREYQHLEEGKICGAVKYREESACYSLYWPDRPPYRYDLYIADERESRGDGAYNHTHHIASWRFEVIGNIHESPHLLSS